MHVGLYVTLLSVVWRSVLILSLLIINTGLKCPVLIVKFIEIQPLVCHGHVSFLQTLWSHLWEEEDVLDGRGVGHEHSQTVDSHTET